jgi:hypothetical protein
MALLIQSPRASEVRFRDGQQGQVLAHPEPGDWDEQLQIFDDRDEGPDPELQKTI